MKVYAFVKIRRHPDPLGAGAQYGDVISFHRIETKRSEEELKFFLPVLVDINIPCGDKYDRGNNCAICKECEPELCDVIKYCRSEWTAGDILNQPKILKKRRYKMDIDSLIPTEFLAVVEKEDKTTEDQALIITTAITTEISASKILDKVK